MEPPSCELQPREASCLSVSQLSASSQWHGVASPPAWLPKPYLKCCSPIPGRSGIHRASWGSEAALFLKKSGLSDIILGKVGDER